MRKTNAAKTRSIATTLILTLLLSGALSGVSYAKDEQTLRVGYVFTEGYQEGGDGEYKTGLGYDFYQKISYYTGWNYEYVYGSFGELLEKLETGEIDIMGNLSYTEERSKTIDFSERMQGHESYYLYTLKSNTRINETYQAALNGKKVGINRGSIQCGLFLDWCGRNGVVCDVIEYDDKTKREEDLKNGIIDATVVPTVMADDPTFADWRAVVKIGESPYYFGVSKKCDSSVKEKLDIAMAFIFEANPNYIQEQYNKYYGGKMLESDFWNALEQVRLSECNSIIKVGYLDECLPFCDMDDNGKVGGLLGDIASKTAQDLQIDLQCISFSRYDDMKAELDSGNLDAIFPARGDYWAAEQQRLFLSDVVCRSNSILVYNGDYSEKSTELIAVSDVSPFQRYSTIINYPDAELLVCPEIDDCIDAVIDGKAGSAIYMREYYETNIADMAASNHLNHSEIEDNAYICFGIRHGDTVMLSICEKWMKLIEDDFINQSVVEHSNIKHPFTLKEYIEENTTAFLLIALLLVALISLGAVYYINKIKKQNAKLLEATKEAEKSKRELIEQELNVKAYRLRMEQELNNSRIKVMMNQMRPHFLYNALSAIQTIVKVDPDYASDLIYDFTTHLRSSITALGSDAPIPFSEELKNIKAYLNIDKMRTGDALKVEYDIQCDTFNVLPLSIQPFAENASRHGIYPKAEEGGTIIIRSYETDDAYVVIIKDDGVGFDVEKVLNEESPSVGLKNTIFRLKTLFNANVSIESELGQGTTVTVTIPKTTTETEEAK